MSLPAVAVSGLQPASPGLFLIQRIRRAVHTTSIQARTELAGGAIGEHPVVTQEDSGHAG